MFGGRRPVEETARYVVVLFGPSSYLLTSDEYDGTLAQVLKESIPEDIEDAAKAHAEVDELMGVLRRRKEAYRRRRILDRRALGEMRASKD